MRKFTTLDNVTSAVWGLTIQESFLFSWMFALPGWADAKLIDDKVFFFASKNKALSDLPGLTDKIDTMYRYYKKLESHGLIELKKINQQDFIRLTEKSRAWNATGGSIIEKIPESNPKKTETIPNPILKKDVRAPDKHPTNRKLISSIKKKDGHLFENKSEIDRVFNESVVLFPFNCRPNKKGESGWKDEIEKLIRLDGMNPNDIVSIVKFARADVFWSKNFLSIRKLRKKNKDGVEYWKVFYNQLHPGSKNDGSGNFEFKKSKKANLA